MAEALFRHRIGEGMEWEADSAGLYAANGSPASTNAIQALEELGIDLTKHQSKFLDPELAEEADLIVPMTASHRFDLLQNFPEVGNRVCLIKSFGTGKVPADISDPFGGSLDIYRETRDEIDRAISDLVLFLRAKNR
jgi:protein-tyrosine-phosphatase